MRPLVAPDHRRVALQGDPRRRGGEAVDRDEGALDEERAAEFDRSSHVEHDGAVAGRDRGPQAARSRVVEVVTCTTGAPAPPGVEAPNPHRAIVPTRVPTRTPTAAPAGSPEPIGGD